MVALDGYALAYASPGVLTVGKAALTVTYSAAPASSTYGSALLGVTGAVGGSCFVAGQGLDALNGVVSWVTTATTGAKAGSYAITGGALTSGNYAITTVQAPGNTSAYTINPAVLIVAADNASQTYNGMGYSGGNGITIAGFVNGDVAANLSGTLAYGGTSQGAKDAGSYTLIATGLSDPNYTITYYPGTLTITPITPIATIIAALPSIYMPVPSPAPKDTSVLPVGLDNGLFHDSCVKEQTDVTITREPQGVLRSCEATIQLAKAISRVGSAQRGLYRRDARARRA